MKQKYRKAVFVVVYRKQRKGNKISYLILKRKLHWKGWEFSKGGIKNKENLSQAVIREVKEETGQKPIRIKRFKEKGRYEYQKGWLGHPGYFGQTYVLFSAEIKNKKIKIDKKEHSGYKWLEFNRARRILQFQNQKKCLNIVNKEVRNEQCMERCRKRYRDAWRKIKCC